MFQNTRNIKLYPQNNYNLTSAQKKNKTQIFTGFNKTGEIPGLLFSCNVAVDLVCCSSCLKDSYRENPLIKIGLGAENSTGNW